MSKFKVDDTIIVTTSKYGCTGKGSVGKVKHYYDASWMQVDFNYINPGRHYKKGHGTHYSVEDADCVAATELAKALFI